jgi:DNA-binding NarL/FixJ family response regulator
MISNGLDSVDIVIADDHALFRDGVRYILEAEPAFRVVGEASDGGAAVTVALRTRPDVVLLDVLMGAVDVTTTVRRLRSELPDSCIIILTMHDDSRLLQTLLDLGIRGYLLKSVGWRELQSAVRSVVADPGRVVLSVSPRTVTRAPRPHQPVLSAREREVLELTAQALSNGQIANRLSVAEATVKRHLHKVFGKLGAVSRIDAVNKARAAGLITTNPETKGLRAGSDAVAHR